MQRAAQEAAFPGDDLLPCGSQGSRDRKSLFLPPSIRTLASFRDPVGRQDHQIREWGDHLLTAVCRGHYPTHPNLADKLRRVLFGENGFSAIV